MISLMFLVQKYKNNLGVLFFNHSLNELPRVFCGRYKLAIFWDAFSKLKSVKPTSKEPIKGYHDDHLIDMFERFICSKLF